MLRPQKKVPCLSWLKTGNFPTSLPSFLERDEKNKIGYTLDAVLALSPFFIGGRPIQVRSFLSALIEIEFEIELPLRELGKVWKEGFGAGVGDLRSKYFFSLDLSSLEGWVFPPSLIMS